MYLCNCHGVTEQDVTDLVNKSESVFQYATIAITLRNSNSCCRCLPRIKEVIDEAVKQKAIKAGLERLS